MFGCSPLREAVPQHHVSSFPFFDILKLDCILILSANFHSVLTPLFGPSCPCLVARSCSLMVIGPASSVAFSNSACMEAQGRITQRGEGRGPLLTPLPVPKFDLVRLSLHSILILGECDASIFRVRRVASIQMQHFEGGNISTPFFLACSFLSVFYALSFLHLHHHTILALFFSIALLAPSCPMVVSFAPG